MTLGGFYFFVALNIDSDEGNKNTTPQITVRVTSTATVNKEDSTTAISVASPSGR